MTWNEAQEPRDTRGQYLLRDRHGITPAKWPSRPSATTRAAPGKHRDRSVRILAGNGRGDPQYRDRRDHGRPPNALAYRRQPCPRRGRQKDAPHGRRRGGGSHQARRRRLRHPRRRHRRRHRTCLSARQVGFKPVWAMVAPAPSRAPGPARPRRPHHPRRAPSRRHPRQGKRRTRSNAAATLARGQARRDRDQKPRRRRPQRRPETIGGNMSDRVNLPPEAEAAGLVGSHFVPETRSPEKANGAAPVGRIIQDKRRVRRRVRAARLPHRRTASATVPVLTHRTNRRRQNRPDTALRVLHRKGRICRRPRGLARKGALLRRRKPRRRENALDCHVGAHRLRHQRDRRPLRRRRRRPQRARRSHPGRGRGPWRPHPDYHRHERRLFPRRRREQQRRNGRLCAAPAPVHNRPRRPHRHHATATL